MACLGGPLRNEMMTPEERLDRLERIAKLFVRAGVRYRRNLRELDDKIGVVVDMQIKYEERSGRNEAMFQVRSVEYDRRFAELAESQAGTDRRLNSLINLVSEGRTGDET